MAYLPFNLHISIPVLVLQLHHHPGCLTHVIRALLDLTLLLKSRLTLGCIQLDTGQPEAVESSELSKKFLHECPHGLIAGVYSICG
jgi:hypothetical protein